MERQYRQTIESQPIPKNRTELEGMGRGLCPKSELLYLK